MIPDNLSLSIFWRLHQTCTLIAGLLQCRSVVLEGGLVTMGERETRVSEAWGLLLARLFEHELVALLSQADVSMLTRPSAALVLYDHMRSFVALKSSVKSSEPSDTLRPAHEALLNFTARLFMAAHQALLNDMQKGDGAKATPGHRAKGQPNAVVPSKRFLLEWQLVRLKAARERLVMELADLSERNEQLFRSLGLPEAISAEVESARLRISDVWKGLPIVLWESSAPRMVGGHIAA
jgi:hypothetical protein